MNRKWYLAIAAAGLALLGVVAAYVLAPLLQPEPRRVVLLTWANYVPVDLLQRLQREHGIVVEQRSFDSLEEMKARLRDVALPVDLVIPAGRDVPALVEEGLLQPLDHSALPGLAAILPAHASPPFDRERRYTIPYLWGTTGFTYDAARTPERLAESWSEFFRPRPELGGKIAALADEIELYNAAAYFLKIDPCTQEWDEARRILRLLQDQAPFLAGYRSLGSVEAMVAGEVILHHQWNGAAHKTIRQLGTAVYVYPREGLTYWMDNMAIPANAADAEAAHEVLEFMLRPENIALASNYTGYMNAISGSSDYLDEDLRNDPAVNMPADKLDRLRPATTCQEEAVAVRRAVWSRLQGGE